MEPGKVIKEEFPGRESRESTKDTRLPSQQGSSSTLNRIRRKGPALKAVPASRSPSADADPGSSPPASPPVGAAGEATESLSSSSSPRPTANSVSSAAAAMGVVNGCSGRLLNGGGSPVMEKTAGSASPPSVPLSLSLSDRSSAFRDGAAAGERTSPTTSNNNSRALAKMKRFLSTLVQFGTNISPETGERVRALVFRLVANDLPVEDFQVSLQEVTNFPLRAFVLPFLRAQLPALQRELHGLAKSAGENALHYLRHHEHILLDPNSPASEALDIFHADSNHAIKRRASYDSLEDADEAENLSSWSKRLRTGYGSSSAGADRVSGGSAVLHPRARHIPPPPHLQTPLNNPAAQHPATGASQGKAQGPGHMDHDDKRNGEEEWKNVNLMLNCVLSMVEKMKHALVILQQRSASTSNVNYTTSSEIQENGVTASTAGSGAVCSRQVKAAVDEIITRTLQDTEERIADLKRRAEEAVNEVRRQAVLEIQRAVAAAESQASELMAAERASMERRLAGLAGVGVGVTSLAGLSALQARLCRDTTVNNGTSPPGERSAHTANSCWNCGRKAHETCSGCNVARYCGAFCQHKDWENHHQVCMRGTVAMTSGPVAVPDSATALWVAERGASAPPAAAAAAVATAAVSVRATTPTASAHPAMVAVSKTSPQK